MFSCIFFSRYEEFFLVIELYSKFSIPFYTVEHTAGSSKEIELRPGLDHRLRVHQQIWRINYSLSICGCNFYFICFCFYCSCFGSFWAQSRLYVRIKITVPCSISHVQTCCVLICHQDLFSCPQVMDGFVDKLMWGAHCPRVIYKNKIIH
jgi:hypothetical protein